MDPVVVVSVRPGRRRWSRWVSVRPGRWSRRVSVRPGRRSRRRSRPRSLGTHADGRRRLDGHARAWGRRSRRRSRPTASSRGETRPRREIGPVAVAPPAVIVDAVLAAVPAADVVPVAAPADAPSAAVPAAARAAVPAGGPGGPSFGGPGGGGTRPRWRSRRSRCWTRPWWRSRRRARPWLWRWSWGTRSRWRTRPGWRRPETRREGLAHRGARRDVDCRCGAGGFAAEGARTAPELRPGHEAGELDLRSRRHGNSQVVRTFDVTAR